MSKTLISILFAAILSLTACNGGSNTANSTTTDATDINTDMPNGTPGLAKSIISEDRYIDIDSAEIEEVLNTLNLCGRRLLGEEIPAVEITDRINDNIAKIKAATYRFYSNLTVVDNKMMLKPSTTARSMKMSEAIFNCMKANNDQTNEFIRLNAESGDSTEIAPITDEYLNSLLE